MSSARHQPLPPLSHTYEFHQSGHPPIWNTILSGKAIQFLFIFFRYGRGEGTREVGKDVHIILKNCCKLLSLSYIIFVPHNKHVFLLIVNYTILVIEIFSPMNSVPTYSFFFNLLDWFSTLHLSIRVLFYPVIDHRPCFHSSLVWIIFQFFLGKLLNGYPKQKYTYR